MKELGIVGISQQGNFSEAEELQHLAEIGRANRMRKRTAQKKYQIVDASRKKRVGRPFWRRDSFDAKRTLLSVSRRSPDNLFSLWVFTKPDGAKRGEWSLVCEAGSNNHNNY
jgi:hypothetical protein